MYVQLCVIAVYETGRLEVQVNQHNPHSHKLEQNYGWISLLSLIISMLNVYFSYILNQICIY